MASRKEYELMFRLAASSSSGFNSTFGSAKSTILQLQNQINALNKTQGDIAAYQRQQAAIENTRKKMDLYQQQLANVQKEMAGSQEFSSALANKEVDLQAKIDKTGSTLSGQTDKLNQMTTALSKAGVDTNNLSGANERLTAKINGVKNAQEEAADEAMKHGSAVSQSFSAMEQAIASAGVVKMLQEIYQWYAACADASMQFESAMTGVAKTTDLTDEEFAAMSQSMKDMSTEIPATTTELGAIAETAGQLGIAKNSLIDFTEIMAELGTATNMTSDEAATMLAQFASITGMDPSLYSNLGSTIVALGNNYATTEKNVADMSQRIAAAGSIAGMSEAEILAVSAAVASLGINTEAGGTALMSLISDINSAVSSGEGLTTWASAAGMTANDFADAWGDNAASALNMFIEGLHDTYAAGGDVYGVLNDLGITEKRMVTTITSLAKSGDRLSDTLQTANTAWADNTALSAEAEKRYATTQSKLILLQNAYNNLKIAVGDGLNPTLSELYTVGADVLNWAAEFAQQNPELVKGISVFIGVLGTATGALAAYTLAAKIANAMNAALGMSLGPIMAAVVAYSAIAGIFVALSDAMNQQLDESWDLTVASRAQYKEIQQLNEEYETLVEANQEASAEAVLLKDKIEELTDEYEKSKQTMEEYNAAHQELMDNYEEMSSSHEEAYKTIDIEERSVLALTARLKELTVTTASAKENQQEILAIINALNDAVPDLALSYDDVVKNAGGVVDALVSAAESLAAKKLLEEQVNDYADRYANRAGLLAEKEDAEFQAQLAQDEYDTAKRLYNEALGYYEQSDPLSSMFGTKEEGAAMDAAKESLDFWNAKVDETTDAYEENEDKLAGLRVEWQAFQEQQEAAAESGGNFNDVVSETNKRIGELVTAYQEAYTAAFNSISGQYSLWDEAADVVVTKTSDINSAMEGQISYWQDYNTDLASLSARTSEIQGLSDVIASFADGSEESVNAIAGMATASDDELKALVDNWKTLQDEQKAASDSLGELAVNLPGQMDQILQEFANAAAEMDLSSEAYESGAATVTAYIDSIEDQTSEAYQAARAVARAAANGFASVTGGGVNVTVNGKSTNGYASGTLNAASGWSWVGELGPELMYMGGGEAILPSNVSMLMADIAGTREGSKAIYADVGDRSGMGSITIKPVYNIAVGSDADAEGLKDALSRINDDLVDKVIEKIDERNMDGMRMAYR